MKGKTDMNIIDRIALILVIIGSLNWGSVGIFANDLVRMTDVSPLPVWARVIYTLVAVAGLWCISLLFRDHREA